LRSPACASAHPRRAQGLAALLVEGLSGCAPEEVLGVTPEFIEMLGLKQSLTPSRNNGCVHLCVRVCTCVWYAHPPSRTPDAAF
jgi:sulfur transfer protein SufE